MARDRQVEARHRRYSPGFARSVAAVALALSIAACNCTPKRASEIAHAGFDTPQHTLQSFRAYASAKLFDLEYRCFSRGFRREVSLTNYGVFREKLQREQPWLFWFDAEVVGERVVEGGAHVLDVRVAGRTVRVKLVREESFGIWAGEDLVNDGPIELAQALDVGRDGNLPDREVLRALLPLESTVDPATITRVTLDSAWKIEELATGADAAKN